MRILVDLTHPAHVHFFRNAVDTWQERGHDVVITARDKDIALQLLDAYGYQYACLSKARRGMLGLAVELLEHEMKLLRLIASFRPDVLLEIGGTFIAHVGTLTRTPVLVFYDTEHARLSNAITYPFASAVVTPSCYEGSIGRKQIVYDGYQELAYLHPDRFTPDPSQLAPFGVSPQQPYIVMRLVAWSSGHDIGDSGFTDLREAVDTLSRYGRVLISSERPLPSGLAQYRVTISPEQIHHLLAFAKLYIGESATMASEGAILGVPSVLVSTSTRGYTNHQERTYGLVYTFSDPDSAQQRGVEKAEELLQRPDLCADWQAKRDHMLTEVIDVTSFVVDIVEWYASGAPR